ncbi:transposase, partial [Domibacillus antri]
ESQLQERIQETFRIIEEQIELDHQILLDSDSSARTISSEDLSIAALEIEAHMKEAEKQAGQEQDPERKNEKKQRFRLIRQLHKHVETDYLPRQARYEAYRETFGERNSFSKTDHDATFMRMKEDHMKNGQLKPGYNVQMATENPFILFYTIHQRPGDTACFIPHLEKLHATSLPFPKRITADSGYGSESNYVYVHELEEQPEALIPYNVLNKEQTRSFKKNIRHVQNWAYRAEDHFYICANNRKVVFKRYSRRTDQNGQVRDFKIYECEDCTECPMKPQCTKAKGNRQVHVNTVYEEMKGKARRSLWSDEGAAVYARRKIEPESVFGHIKGNRS